MLKHNHSFIKIINIELKVLNFGRIITPCINLVINGLVKVLYAYTHILTSEPWRWHLIIVGQHSEHLSLHLRWIKLEQVLALDEIDSFTTWKKGTLRHWSITYLTIAQATVKRLAIGVLQRRIIILPSLRDALCDGLSFDFHLR